MSAIPTFEEMMLPVLKIIKDGKEYSNPKVEKELCVMLMISEKDQKIKDKQGRRTVSYNLGWAKSYLKRCGLIGNKHAKFQITNKGTKLLRNPPSIINRRFLRENCKSEAPGSGSGSKFDPNKWITKMGEQINQELIKNLHARMSSRSVSSVQFEKIVADVLEKSGYNVKRVGKTNDGGVDIEIQRDELGLDMMYCQVKKYSNGKIDPDRIRAFAGALDQKKAKYGIFVTLSDFTNGARKTADSVGDKSIKLINGTELINMMIERGVGVVEDEYTISVKEIDNSYFKKLETQ